MATTAGTWRLCAFTVCTAMVVGIADAQNWELLSQADGPFDGGSSNLPSARYASAFAQTTNGLFLFGGIGTPQGDTNGDPVVLDDLWFHELLFPGWERQGDGPTPRAHAMMWARQDGSVLLHGGSYQDTYLSDTWEYGDSWNMLSSGILPRAGAATWSIGGSHYMFGGINQSSYLNDVQYRNDPNNSWIHLEVIGPAPLPRAYSRAVVDDVGNVWLFGGYGDTGGFSDLWSLDVSSGRWERESGSDLANLGPQFIDPVRPPALLEFSMHYFDGLIGIYAGISATGNGVPPDSLVTADYFWWDPIQGVWNYSGPTSTDEPPNPNYPGSRAGFAYATDIEAPILTFWIFGGRGRNETNGPHWWYNDMWKATFPDQPTIESEPNASTTTGSPETPARDPSNAWILPVVLTSVAFCLVVLFVLAGITYYKRKKNNRSDSMESDGDASDGALVLQESPGIKYLSNVTVQGMIGTGNFGAVYKGLWMDTTMVALKQLMENQIQEFQREASILCKLVHPNIVQFLGINKATSGVHYLVMEFMADGSLLELLRKMPVDSLSVSQLMSMCIGACSGMRYLEESKVIHRDLACRNLLVNSSDGKFIVKVSDFGMSVSSDYYKSSEDKLIPIRWTAPEAIERRSFSTKSDVWSFAVCIWEIFTYGKVPYSNLDHVHILDHLTSGNRLPQPDNCSDELYSLCSSCWNIEPSQRPSFELLCRTLREMGKDGEEDVEEGTFELSEVYANIREHKDDDKYTKSPSTLDS